MKTPPPPAEPANPAGHRAPRRAAPRGPARHAGSALWPLLLAAALVTACGSAPEQGPVLLDRGQLAEAEKQDLLARLDEALRRPQEDPALLMNSLERLLLSWQGEQRKGRARQLESVLTQKVVPNYEVVADFFESGPHPRRVVAAWALGFSRVPENDLGLVSRHREALALLMEALPSAPDDVLGNMMLAVWKIGDVETPLRPILDVATHHHDPVVRANATLALTTILTPERVEEALDTLLLALDDDDEKVRLHAASVAAYFPHPALAERMRSLIGDETTPLVRARLAMALGASGDRDAARVLVPLLSSPRHIESWSARQALTALFGEDLGPDPGSWQERIVESEAGG